KVSGRRPRRKQQGDRAMAATLAGRPRTSQRVTQVLFYIGVTLMILFCVAPLLWVLDEALKPTIDLQAAPPTAFPSHITFDSFRTAFEDRPAFIGHIKT